MILEDLITRLGFKVDSSPLDEVTQRLESIQRGVHFLGAVEVIKGVVEMGKRFGEFAEQLGKSAVASGVSVEELQKLQIAAAQSGIGAQEVTGAMGLLSRQLYAARNGGKQAQEAFAQLGISPGAIAGFHTTKDALAAMADKIKGIEDPVKRSALTMALLGRSAGQMTEFLAQGSQGWATIGKEAEDAGAVLSGKQVTTLRETGDALSFIATVARNFAATIAADFGPSIQSAVKHMLDFWKANRKFIEEKAEEWIGDFTFALGYLYAAIEYVVGGIINFAKEHPKLASAIGTVVAVVFSLAAGLAAIHAGFSIVRTAIGVFKSGLTGLTSVVNAFMSPWFLIPALLFTIWQTMSSIYDMIFNAKSFEDTPVGKFFNLLFRLAGRVIKFTTGVDVDADELTRRLGDIGGESKKPILTNTAPLMETLQQGNAALTGMWGMAPSPMPLVPVSSPVTTNNVQAPVTINVPAGTSPQDVAQAVATGIQNHHDKLHRETQRGTESAIAY